jgi:hypothetical protein
MDWMTRRHRTLPATNARTQAAVDRFSAAAQGLTDDLHDATGALLEAFANATQRQVTQAFALLVERLDAAERRLDKLEKQIMLHQRHLEQLDLVEDTRARTVAEGERTVGP